MSHFTTVWLKENQVRLVGSYRSFSGLRLELATTREGFHPSLVFRLVAWNRRHRLVNVPMLLNIPLHGTR